MEVEALRVRRFGGQVSGFGSGRLHSRERTPGLAKELAWSSLAYL